MSEFLHRRCHKDVSVIRGQMFFIFELIHMSEGPTSPLARDEWTTELIFTTNILFQHYSDSEVQRQLDAADKKDKDKRLEIIIDSNKKLLLSSWQPLMIHTSFSLTGRKWLDLWYLRLLYSLSPLIIHYHAVSYDLTFDSDALLLAAGVSASTEGPFSWMLQEAADLWPRRAIGQAWISGGFFSCGTRTQSSVPPSFSSSAWHSDAHWICQGIIHPLGNPPLIPPLSALSHPALCLAPSPHNPRYISRLQLPISPDGPPASSSASFALRLPLWFIFSCGHIIRPVLFRSFSWSHCLTANKSFGRSSTHNNAPRLQKWLCMTHTQTYRPYESHLTN